MHRLDHDAVLRVGEVTEVSGRRISVTVDRKKNVSDLLFEGQPIRNIAVNSYVEIRKGFISLIGKVDGEQLIEESRPALADAVRQADSNRRILEVSLSGYIDRDGRFRGGLRELPLVGNEVFLVTKEKMATIHDLVSDGRTSIDFAVTDNEGFEIAFPIDGLFNSHIAIFGNTGSGKSNTLAALYAEFVRVLSQRNSASFKSGVRIVLFDFNGEYADENCITQDKRVFRLSTRGKGDKVPLPKEVLLDVEILAILADATEKTQKPFLRRTLRLYHHIFGKDAADPNSHFQNMLRQRVKQTLTMSDKTRADLIMDYYGSILPEADPDGEIVDLRSGLDWNNKLSEFVLNGQYYLKSNPDQAENSAIYQHVQNFTFEADVLSRVVTLLYFQLISDVLTNRAQNEHIAPAINKLLSKKIDVEHVFNFDSGHDVWSKNVVVISLDGVSLDMRKTVPLLLSKHLYAEHRKLKAKKSLTFIIDEAHNILSRESFREAESWKDYRLETFEEIIKEGRKFGVFVTISSQRPSDISPTITSQAHNYFVHRLVNERDLATIASAVSYIDKVSEESIPTLPTGTCIFSGVAGQMPLKLRIKALPPERQPQSHTLRFDDVVPK